VIKNIQALRAVAAILVVFVHLRELLQTANLPAFGYGGVDLFFVISGFVMVHTTQYAPPSPGSFIRNRLARIVPLYWLMTISVFAVAFFTPKLLGSTTTNIVHLLKSLLFIPFMKSDGLVQPTLFVGWTLNYEMFFYAVFAIGLIFKNYLIGVGYIFSILTVVVIFGFLQPAHGLLISFYTDPIILDFLLGMAVALAGRFLQNKVPKAGMLFIAISIGCLLIIVFAPIVWPNVNRVITRAIPAAVLVCAVVLLEHWGWIVQNRFVMALGEASYVLYLSHPYVTQTIQKAGVFLHSTGSASIALAAGGVGCVMLIALILNRFVEQPLSKQVRKWLAPAPLQLKPA